MRGKEKLRQNKIREDMVTPKKDSIINEVGVFEIDDYDELLNIQEIRKVLHSKKSGNIY